VDWSLKKINPEFVPGAVGMRRKQYQSSLGYIVRDVVSMRRQLAIDFVKGM
jgi:hypothetical protein